MEARAGRRWTGSGGGSARCSDSPRCAACVQPGPLPTRWKNHFDKLLPHPRALKPVVHHAAHGLRRRARLVQKLLATDTIPELCLAFTILTAMRSQEARGAKLERDRPQGQGLDGAARADEAPKRPHNVPLSPPGAGADRTIAAQRASICSPSTAAVRSSRCRCARRCTVTAPTDHRHGFRSASATGAASGPARRGNAGGRARARDRQRDRGRRSARRICWRSGAAS